MDQAASTDNTIADPEGLEDPNEAAEPTEAVAPDGELNIPPFWPVISLRLGRPGRIIPHTVY